MAKTRLPKDIGKKVEEWKNSSGALVMCLVAYYDGNRVQSFQYVKSFLITVPVSSFSSIESTPLIGNAFTNSCDEWRDGTYENFKGWAVRQFGVEELDSNDEAEVPVDKQKSKDIVFEKNNRGHFILPPKQDFPKNRQRQKVIRGYIGAVYRKSIHSLVFLFFFHSKDR